MLKYSYAERVVSKIQQLTRDDSRVNGIVSKPFKAVLNDRCELESVEWKFTNYTVIAYANCLMYFDGEESQIPILTYDGFDDLLVLKKEG